MTTTAEFEAKMAELSAAFSRRTAEDAAEFEMLGVAIAGADSADHRARIQYLAHRLAGGSATFGLVALERPAGDLEGRILAEASAAEIGAGSRALAATIRMVCGTADAGEGACHGTT